MKNLIFILLIFIVNLQANNYGALLFNGNCTTCHFETKTISAPSVVEFKKRYKEAFLNREDFIENMATWVQHPDAKTSIMLDAIEKHELMPELGFDEDTLKQIISYIYDTDFTKKQNINNLSIK